MNSTLRALVLISALWLHTKAKPDKGSSPSAHLFEADLEVFSAETLEAFGVETFPGDLLLRLGDFAFAVAFFGDDEVFLTFAFAPNLVIGRFKTSVE